MKHFYERILLWYESNKRNLPWRHTRDPFKIWLSEIIFQQTRISQGWDYYLRFTERFRDVSALAAASEDEVLKLWQGLGYYSRARNLHTAAKQVMSEFGGHFPADYSQLLKLKGVGEYSAAAIASLAFGLPYPVIDGNVFRLMSRYAMIEYPVNSGKGKKEIWALLTELIDKNRPGDFNQAVIELGALVCTPRNPLCNECPLQIDCQAFTQHRTHEFPVKTVKDPPRDRYLQYLFILFQQDNIWCTLLRKRKPGDIWAGLYEFPLLESERQLTENEVKEHNEFRTLIQDRSFETLHYSPAIHHQLSHRNLHVHFLTIRLNDMLLLSDSDIYTMVHLNDLLKYPVSRLMERYLSNSLIINIINRLLKKV